jgi:CBS domain-containing protein
MSTPLIAVETTTSIRGAQQLMEDQHIRHLPVVRDNKLVGILSSGDIRRANLLRLQHSAFGKPRRGGKTLPLKR